MPMHGPAQLLSVLRVMEPDFRAEVEMILAKPVSPVISLQAIIA